jgi:hypothetical protein
MRRIPLRTTERWPAERRRPLPARSAPQQVHAPEWLVFPHRSATLWVLTPAPETAVLSNCPPQQLPVAVQPVEASEIQQLSWRQAQLPAGIHCRGGFLPLPGPSPRLLPVAPQATSAQQQMSSLLALRLAVQPVCNPRIRRLSRRHRRVRPCPVVGLE